MDKKQYLGVDLDDLRFVRVIKGIKGFTAKEDGSLNIKLKPDSSFVRNTTHCTLNSIVGDHYAGKFSASRFAVIGGFFWILQRGMSLLICNL